MSNSQLINDFVIKPLMLRNKANTFEQNKIVGNTETNLNSQKVNKRKTYIK